MSADREKRWRIGELARAAGLTVRALHHYDELGLLVPSERSHAGYRTYGEAELRRLYQIIALRRLGLNLGEVATLLDGGGVDFGETVRRQLVQVEAQLTETRRLRDRLSAIRDTLKRQDAPSIDQLIKTMEAITMHEKYYTTDQLRQLEQRREQLGDEAIKDSQREWEEIFEVLRAEMEAGTDPSDPKLDPFRVRAEKLVQSFTGGDPAISRSLGEMWANEDPETVSRGMVDRDLWDYYGRVCGRRGD